MPFLTSPLIYVIAFLLATNIISGIGWKWSATNAEAERQKVVACQAKHDAFVAQTQAAGKLAAEKAKAQEKEHARISDATAKGWASAIDVVRADYAQRVRDAARRSAGGSGLSAPTQDRPGDAQASTDAVPSPARVAADCAETTITLNYLQSYIERIQHE